MFRRPSSALPFESVDESIQDFGLDIRIGFSNDQRSWEESENLLDCLQSVLGECGHIATVHDEFLVVEPGLKITPKMTWFKPNYPSGIRTTTLVFTEYGDKIPSGTFEFQHAVGDDLRDSLCQGFKSWASVDFPVLREFANDKLTECTAMEVNAPATATRPPTLRRIVLGPPARMYRNLPPESEEHCFCPCCLLTNSFEAFRDLIDGDSFAAVRLLAFRNDDGTTSADCRINGEEFDTGKLALAKYATTWPGTGFEMRKQYILFEPRRISVSE